MRVFGRYCGSTVTDIIFLLLSYCFRKSNSVTVQATSAPYRLSQHYVGSIVTVRWGDLENVHYIMSIITHCSHDHSTVILGSGRLKIRQTRKPAINIFWGCFGHLLCAYTYNHLHSLYSECVSKRFVHTLKQLSFILRHVSVTWLMQVEYSLSFSGVFGLSQPFIFSSLAAKALLCSPVNL